MAKPTKTDLRKEFLAKREGISDEDRKRFNSLIRQRLFQHPVWKNAATVLVYVSFGSEVDTHLLIQEALRFKKRVIIPLFDPAMSAPALSELQRFSELTPASGGKMLTHHSDFRRPFEPAGLELALVPGIAFDRSGGRIGFGGGYFDRLLPQAPKAIRVALAFSIQVSPTTLPLEVHDVKMNFILTDTAAIEVKS